MPTRIMRKIFVYGTLKCGQRLHHMLKLSRSEGEDTIQLGRLYDLGYFPVLVRHDPPDITHGEVYNCANKAVEELDKLEGCPTYFERIPTVTKGGINVEVYVMKTVPEYAKYLPSGNWDGRKKES